MIIDCNQLESNSIDMSLKIREYLLGLGIPTYKHPKMCGTVPVLDKNADDRANKAGLEELIEKPLTIHVLSDIMVKLNIIESMPEGI